MTGFDKKMPHNQGVTVGREMGGAQELTRK